MEFEKVLQNKRTLLQSLKLFQKIETHIHHQTGYNPFKKKKGIYYTPKEISLYICFQTITSYILQGLNSEGLSLQNLLNQNSPKYFQKVLDYLDTIRILDPACGTGIFLIEVAEILYRIKQWLLEKLEKPVNPYELKRKILLDNIYGIDLFIDAVKATKQNLLQWLSSDNYPINDLHKSQLLDWNIRQGNSLIGWLNEKLTPYKFDTIINSDLSQKIQYLQEVIPSLEHKFQSINSMLHSSTVEPFVNAFITLKKLWKDHFDSYGSLIAPVLLEFHQIIYELINPSFINSYFPEDSSHEVRNPILNEFESHYPFHWQVDFGEILREGGFDIIVGNPPYVFIRGKNFSFFENRFYKKKYLMDHESFAKGKAKQSRKINLFSLFIIRSLNLLKQNRYLGFIIPNTILRTTTNDFIRHYILKNTFIQEIVDLKGGVFKGVTASTLLLFLQKSFANKNSTTLIAYNVENLLNYQFDYHFINQVRFLNNPVLAFNIHLDSELEKVFNILKENTIPLGKLTREIIEGIVCRKNDGLFIDNPNHPLAKKLLRGKNISRYQINWKSNQYIIYATDKSLTKNKLHRPRPQWIHEASEKLLAQRIGGSAYPLQIAYDNSQFYTFASINNILFKSPLVFENQEFLSKYILAILNSKLINAYYLLNFSNISSYTVNISKTFLEALPIKKISLKTQKVIETIADYLLFLYQFHKDKISLIEFFDFSLLDSLIYEIYLPELLETNLCEVVSNYLISLPDNVPPEEKLHTLLQIKNTLQKNPKILDLMQKIKTNEFILRIENLFKNRANSM